jgi:hypothetical protein
LSMSIVVDWHLYISWLVNGIALRGFLSSWWTLPYRSMMIRHWIYRYQS